LLVTVVLPFALPWCAVHTFLFLGGCHGWSCLWCVWCCSFRLLC
jgi:hypothetical protein